MANPVAEKAMLPTSIEAGPHTRSLTALTMAMSAIIAESGFRLNRTAPKDGSELQQMTSYDSVDYAVPGNVNNADFGYYTFARFTLTGGSYDLTGIADGAGQEGLGGRLLRIVNTSASGLTLTLKHEDGSSISQNRFWLPGSGDYEVAQHETVQLWYDMTSYRWRVAA